jgi:hypothetical protein
MASIKLKGDTSGEVTISAPSVAGTTTLELPATSSTLATQNSLGVRNLIINGDMRIAQRGTSSTGITSTFSYHTVDRWFTQGTSSFGTFTQTQDTDVPSGQGFANSLKMQCTTANASLSAGSYLRLEQRIEGQNLQHLKYGTSNAESLTLSFWVKSNKTGTYVCWLYQDSTVRGVSASYTISSSDTWEKKTITFSGDTSASSNIVNDNSSELRILFQLVAGTDWSSGTLQTSWGNFVYANSAVGQVNLADSTSNYINITGVQLEVGTEATPFEHRPYDMELQRCQRYYQQLGTFNSTGYSGVLSGTASTSAAIYRCDVPLSCNLRANPSVGLVNLKANIPGNTIRTVTSLSNSFTDASKRGLQLDIILDATLTSTYGVRGVVYTNNNGNDALVTIDAEL